MSQLSIIKQMFKSLTEHEKQDFIDYLKHEEQADNKSFNNLEQLILNHKHTEKGDRPFCPHCGSNNIIKHGHKNGTQRYHCKDCGKTFSITNDTMLFSTKKKLSVWEKYMECIMNKFPLRKCAAICGICVSTAFIWRHKILDALQNMHDDVTLNGVTESDETYFPISYKGNHAKSDFQMPRASHKRGEKAEKRGISKEKACVLCGVNLDGLSIGMISNLGRPFVGDLEAVFNDRIEKGSILVTDSFRGYSKLANRNELTHIAIPRGKHKNGAFNIQAVNSYHSEMIRLVQSNFKGVSTKYLNNYIVYHNFVNFAKETFKEKLSILKDFAFTTKLNDKCKLIPMREPIPTLRDST